MSSPGPSAADALKALACTATSCAVADTICLPLDFLKVRQQLQNELVPSSAPRMGMLPMAAQIWRNEGFAAFLTGLPAAVLRQATYGGLSFAAYPYLRDAIAPRERKAADAPMYSRIAAGALAGAGASYLANPTDVVKVRLQADNRSKGKVVPRYTGMAHAFAQIGRVEGLAAFWAGWLPNVQRAAVVNGSGMAAYDASRHAAQALLGESGSSELSLKARFLAALVGGVVTSLVGCPFDVLKTRLMNQGPDSGGRSVRDNIRPHMPPRRYDGLVSCLTSTVRVEGVLALWKGLLPVYCRQAPFKCAIPRIEPRQGLCCTTRSHRSQPRDVVLHISCSRHTPLL